MSMRPKRACAAATAAAICASSLTSRSTASARSGASATSSARRDLSRAVITARRPAARTWRASSYPKPVEQPVMNHTCEAVEEVEAVDAVIVVPFTVGCLERVAKAMRACYRQPGGITNRLFVRSNIAIGIGLFDDQVAERGLDIFGMQMAHDVFQRRVLQQQAGRRGGRIPDRRMRFFWRTVL